MGDEESIPITYETLFEFLRIEKSREELQKLDDGFYNHVIQYLKQKQDMLDKKRHESDLFAAEEIADCGLPGLIRETIPFLLTSLIVLILVTYIPAISLWLPHQFGF